MARWRATRRPVVTSSMERIRSYRPGFTLFSVSVRVEATVAVVATSVDVRLLASFESPARRSDTVVRYTPPLVSPYSS